MPYIPQTNRELYFDALDSVSYRLQERVKNDSSRNVWPGELTYIVFTLMIRSIIGAKSEMRYTDYALLKGVLASVASELDRRFIDGYEQRKLEENGDV